jgi:hypothetical protein
MKTTLIAATALMALLAIPTQAQPVRQCVAQWTPMPPVIDGKLDDQAWRGVREEGGFVVVSEPLKHPQAPTFVKVLTDGSALYLGFRCVEPAMDKIRVIQDKRDESVWTDDSLEIILDPDNQRTRLYHLIINSAGVQYDAEGKITPPETSHDDAQWNGKWESACTRGNGEWYAEIRLPFTTFGIAPEKTRCVGLNLGRGRVGAHREDSSWSPTRIEYVNPAHLGELYLPDDRGWVLKVGLPGLHNVVRGTERLDLEFVNTSKVAQPLRWSAATEGAVKTAESSGNLTVAAKQSLKTQIPISTPQTGDAHFKLTVQDEKSGRTLYNGSRSFKVLPEIEMAEALYALQYHRAEATIKANLPAGTLKGARLEVSLLRRGETAPLESRTERLNIGASNVFSFSLEGKTAGEYFLRAQVRKGAKTLASANSLALPFTPNPKVGFDRDGFLTVDGKPFFPVGIYTLQARSGNDHDAIMEEGRQAGFNSTVFYAYTVETITPLLDAAQRHSLRAFVYPANPFRVREHTATRDELVGEIKARMNHPALLGWYLVDEPEGIGVSSVETVRNYYQLVKETDPAHPCSLVIMSPGAAANYGNSADIVWIDPYPVPYSPVTYVSQCMDGAHASVTRDKPVWAIPQAFDWNVWKNGRIDKIHRPTPEEERCMTYLAVVHGAKGIIYWAHTGSKYYIHDYPEHWAAVKKIAGELRDLSPVLLTVNPRIKAKASPATATVDLMVKQLNGEIYVFAVNRETKGCQAEITLTGPKPASDIEVLFENRSINPNGKGWTDSFQPFEVHVYRLKSR